MFKLITFVSTCLSLRNNNYVKKTRFTTQLRKNNYRHVPELWKIQSVTIRQGRGFPGLYIAVVVTRLWTETYLPFTTPGAAI